MIASGFWLEVAAGALLGFGDQEPLRMPENDRQLEELTSWDEIATFLGVAKRTAQKWEKTRGLPIKRFPGQKGRVAADAAQLRHWQETAYRRAAWHSNLVFLRYYAAATTLLVVLGLGVSIGVYINTHRVGPPAGYRVVYRTLIVTDQAGREVWRHDFPKPLLPQVYSDMGFNRRIWFGDLDGAGGVETLFVYFPTSLETDGTTLFCFDRNGAVKWTFATDHEVSDSTRTFLPIYLISHFLVEDLNRDATPEILVTSQQLDSHPNRFAVLDPTGAVVSEYWHSGHLPHMVTADIEGDGTQEILLGGINNGRRAAVVIILKADKIGGASQQPPGDPFQLRGLGPGTEQAVIVFPRTCINQKLEEYNGVSWVTARNNLIRVKVAERRVDPTRLVIYNLDNDLKVTYLRWADLLKDLHREMESRGELDHPLTQAEIDGMRNLTIIRDGD